MQTLFILPGGKFLFYEILFSFWSPLYPEKGNIFGSCVQCRRIGRIFLHFVIYMYPGFCIPHVSCILCSVSCIPDFVFYMNPGFCILHESRILKFTWIPDFVFYMNPGLCSIHVSRILYSTRFLDFVSYMYPRFCALQITRIL